MFKSVIPFGVVVFLSYTSAITDEQKIQIQNKFKEMSSECIKDHPLTSDDLNSFNQNVFPASKYASCFTACIFNKVGIFDDKGTLSQTAFENAKVFEEEEHLKEIGEFLSTCSKVNDEDVDDGELGCDRAKLAFNCYVDNHEKFNFDLAF